MNEQPPQIANELLLKDIEHLKKDIEELRHSVYGNGHKGIKAELIELRTEFHTIKKFLIWQIRILVAILCALIKGFL